MSAELTPLGSSAEVVSGALRSVADLALLAERHCLDPGVPEHRGALGAVIGQLEQTAVTLRYLLSVADGHVAADELEDALSRLVEGVRAGE